MINSRLISELFRPFQSIVLNWLAECEKAGLDILIVRTYSDDEYQNWLYASGRTREGKICTYARGGESEHNKRLAVDFCIMQGKTCDWNNKAAFTQAGIIAERLGLIWSGRWAGKMKEVGHIQYR